MGYIGNSAHSACRLFRQVKPGAIPEPRLYEAFRFASWMLTGKMWPFTQKTLLIRPVPESKDGVQDGIGAWDVTARFSDNDLTDGLV